MNSTRPVEPLARGALARERELFARHVEGPDAHAVVPAM